MWAELGDDVKYVVVNNRVLIVYFTLFVKSLIKLHKPENHIRPTVTWRKSPGSKLAQFIADVISQYTELPYAFNVKKNNWINPRPTRNSRQSWNSLQQIKRVSREWLLYFYCCLYITLKSMRLLKNSRRREISKIIPSFRTFTLQYRSI